MTQTNPVLFVMLGRAAETMPLLFKALEDYRMINGIAFVTVSQEPDGEWARGQVNRIQQVLSKKRYSVSGVIRVNYLLFDDQFNLTSTRRWLERYLSFLYPNGTLTDVYWFLDDASGLDGRTESRIHIMNMLGEGQIPDSRIYLLSNLDDKNDFHPDTDIIRTIALLTLFKDYKPIEYVVAPDASRYNEYFFTENGYAPHKGVGFLTAASSSLWVPPEALKSLLVAALLNYGREDMNEGSSVMDFPTPEVLPPVIMNPEYVYGLAIPNVDKKETEYVGLTRRRLIRRLFGDRLGRAATMYAQGLPVKDSDLAKNTKNANIANTTDITEISYVTRAVGNLPFFEAVRITKEGGAWATTAEKLLKVQEEALSVAEDELKQWLSEKHDLKSSPKRRLSMFAILASEETWPYELAAGYMERYFKIQAIETRCAQLRHELEQIGEAQRRLTRYLHVIDSTLADLGHKTQAMNDIFAEFIPYVSDYFLGRFERFARANPEDIRSITLPLTKYLYTGDFSLYLEKLESFVEKYVLPSPEFNRPFMQKLDELARGYSDTPLPKLLSEWILRNRHWSIRLKTGYSSLHSETNVTMSTQGAAATKKAFESHGWGRMNLFIDEKAVRIDVLYHAGSFSLDDLYYRDLYV